MHRRRWLINMLLKALAHRTGRTLLLLAVLAMASSLATALGIVSVSMGKRVAEEVRKYGANMIVSPSTARLDVGSGGLNFGSIAEPAYLKQQDVVDALARSGLKAERSFHLRGALHWKNSDVMVEGVNFVDIRRLFPWWQLKGNWPAAGEAVLGNDLATRLKLKPGDVLELEGQGHSLHLRVSGTVSSGGEEDGLLFMALPELQQALGLEGRLTLVRLMVTVVVLVSSGSSVTGTMSTTVLERGKEIGLMKAMGATRWEVLLIFCGEAALLGVAGGVVGYLLGTGIAQFITKTVFASSAEFVPWISALSLGVSLFLALLGSIGPMVSVFKLDPVKSLRGE